MSGRSSVSFPSPLTPSDGVDDLTDDELEAQGMIDSDSDSDSDSESDSDDSDSVKSAGSGDEEPGLRGSKRPRLDPASNGRGVSAQVEGAGGLSWNSLSSRSAQGAQDTPSLFGELDRGDGASARAGEPRKEWAAAREPRSWRKSRAHFLSGASRSAIQVVCELLDSWGPSKVDAEVRMLCLGTHDEDGQVLLTALLVVLLWRVGRMQSFDIAQAQLGLALRAHADVIGASTALRRIVAVVREVQAEGGERLQRLLRRTLCIASYVAGVQ